MKFGRLMGVILAVLGVIASAIFAFQIANHGAILRILIAGPSMLLLGIAMIALPGTDISVGEFNANPGNDWWSESPLWVRGVWVAAGVAGLFVSFPYVV